MYTFLRGGVAALFILFMAQLGALAAPSFVFHARATSDVTEGFPDTDCPGPLPFVNLLAPASGDDYLLRLRIQLASQTDEARVYYTIDGTAPEGAMGVGSNTTQVVSGTYECGVTNGGVTFDIVSATIPAQPEGTTVRYIVSAWDSLSGPELFGNSGLCDGCDAYTNAPQATVFSYVVVGSPVITTQPASLTVNQGDPAVLNVVAIGVEPLSYQWFFGDTELVGETNAMLSIASADGAAAGTYVVVVSNSLGSAFSDEAKLSVVIPPEILVQPEDTLVAEGGTAVLLVAAAGTEPFTYQWFLAGDPVPDATNSILAIVNAQSSDAGAYVVQVSNSAGMVVSDPAVLTLGSAPSFLVQPADEEVSVGQTAIFNASATGSEPLFYQWFFLSNAIPGATNPVLTRPNAGASDAGTYTLSVSNEYGMVISRPALLTVLLPPAILVHPVDLVVTQNQAAIFSVTASGAAPLSYQWYYNGTTPLPQGTNAILTLTNVQAAHEGLYSVVVSNSLGVAASDPANLQALLLPTILAQPRDRTVLEGSSALFGIVAEGTPPLTYQWRKDGQPLTSRTNSTLIVTNTTPASGGVYDVLVFNPAGVILSSPALLTILERPRILQQPASLVVTQGFDAFFEVLVAGSPPLSYQWFFNDTNVLAGATNTTLLIPQVTGANDGTYRLRVANQVTNVFSDPATLTVRRPPTILAQPESLEVGEGDPASFTVLADGEAPLTYRWFRNGSLVPGGTTNELTIASVSTQELGAYTVSISNQLGLATSDPAFLAFRVPPSIAQPPQDLTITNGSDATFTVGITGSEPFSIQWFFDGTNPIPGATNSTLQLSGAGLDDAGAYSVTVTNLAGSVTSPAATLTVLSAPDAPDSPLLVECTNTYPVTLTMPAVGTLPFTYQWYRGTDTLLLDQTNATLTLDPAGVADEDEYRVVIANELGLDTGVVALVVWGEDFGDAPSPPFATLRSGDGAHHRIVEGYQLGAEVDVDDDGQPDVQATGDDLDGTPDEDGVTFLTPLVRSLTTELSVVASTNGLLNAWVDFNNDGDWNDAGEQVFDDVALAPGGNPLAFGVPATAAVSDTFTRFRFDSSGGLGVAGAAADGEVEDYRVAIAPVVDLSVRAADTSDPLAIGATVTVTATVTNLGLNQATGVVLSQPLPANAQFLNATASSGSCALSGTTVTCSLGSLAIQAGRSVTVQWRALAPGTHTNIFIATANEADANPTNSIARETTTVTYPVPTFVNQDAIITPDFDDGPGFPYPTTILLSGLTSTVAKATVRIKGITHSFPDDLDILLVGPQGQSVMLMSDSGGGTGAGICCSINGAILTFDDASTNMLPNTGPPEITTGTYRPTNFGSPESNPFVPPAPAESPQQPYGSALSVFKGTNPNGAWSLYVMDDLPEDSGFITDGWDLNLTLADPLADVGVSISDSPDPVAVESNITYTVTVNNLGPSAATGLVLESPVPPGMLFTSATAAAGSCTVSNGVIRCSLNPLSPSASTIVTILLAPVTGGTVTNSVRISTLSTDQHPANNLASASTRVILVNDLELTGGAAPDPVLLGQPLTFTMSVTNLGPYDANDVLVIDQVPSGFEVLDITGTLGSCTNLGGTIRCDVGTLPAGGGATFTLAGRALALGTLTNAVTVLESESDFNPSNNQWFTTVTVLPAADLAAQLLATPDPSIVGGLLTYTLVITNGGPEEAVAVQVEDQLPASVALLQAIPLQGSCTNLGGLVTCDLGSLAAGTATLVTLEVMPMADTLLTNLMSVSSPTGDPNPANNLAEVVSAVDPAADLAVTVRDQMEPVLLGESMTYTVTVTNRGPDRATGVWLTNLLSAELTALDASSTRGTCILTNGSFLCHLGTFEVGEKATITLLVRALTAGIVSVTGQVTGDVADLNTANNSATETTSVIIDTGVFASEDMIDLPDSGPASIYPSTIFVSGVTVRVDSVSITLSNLSHSYASDLDILLEGPGGQTVLLMSDAIGNGVLLSTSLAFSDEANQFLPTAPPITSGSYRPTQYEPGTDVMPAPAPAAPYGTNLAVFSGLDPNGTWSLYINDDFPKDSGLLAGGWSLRFATLEPLADLAVNLAAPPATALGSNLVMTTTVTNRGPSEATGVRLTQTLPATGLGGLTIQTDHGTCTNDNGVLICELGVLAADEVATVLVSGIVLGPDPLASSATVAGDQIDVRPSNDESSVLVPIQDPPLLVSGPTSLTVTNGADVSFLVEAAGSEPLSYQWFQDGAPLAGATNALLALINVQAAQQGAYVAVVSNLVGVVMTPPADLTVLVPVSIVEQPQDLILVARNTATFVVVASGSGPIGYQWFFNSSPIPGATQSQLTIPEVAPSDAGTYHVIVSNILNTVTSRPTLLEVQVLDFGDAPGPGFPTLLSANGARHRILPGIQLGAAIDADPDGQPEAMALGDDLENLADEDGVRFLTPLVPGQPAMLEVVASTNGFLDAWLDTSANGTWAEAGEQVMTNTVLLTGTNLVSFVVPSNAVQTTTFARFRFSRSGGLAPTGPAPSGEVEDYAVQVVRLADLVVTVVDQPDPVRFGFNVVYTIGVTNQGPLTASNVTFTSSAGAGLNVLSVSNTLGSCSTGAGTACFFGDLAVGQGVRVQITALALQPGPTSLEVIAMATEEDPHPENNHLFEQTDIIQQPVIVTQPQPQSVVQGGTAMFGVGATGHLLAYQWWHGSVALPGATNASLVLTNVSTANAGSYGVTVSNQVGVATSSTASLTVLIPPTLVIQPQPVTINESETAMFNVSATGTLPIHYQWRHNGVILPGATNATLILTNTVIGQAGTYDVFVSNAGGSLLSNPARLDFAGAPVILQQPQSRTNFVGTTASFQVLATGTQPLGAQWYRNLTTPIPGATNLTLTLTNVQLADIGLFQVALANNQGSVTSATAQLIVFLADFGDAPADRYPTRLSQDGPYHHFNETFYLGQALDAEPDGQPNADATGDDISQGADEDGVSFTQPFLIGQTVAMNIAASRVGLLSAWLDFNANDSWADPGEQIFTNLSINGGVSTLQVNVPANAAPGRTFARFRFSNTRDLGFTGPASIGEVEDHALDLRLPVELGVGLTATPSIVPTSGILTWSILVTNAGPFSATNVELTDPLPEGVTFDSVISTHGGCTNAGGLVTCNLGTLPPGQVAQIGITVIVGPVDGILSNTVTVTSDEVDLMPANNSATLATMVTGLPIILAQPMSLSVTNGAMAVFSVQATGIGPLAYQWTFEDAPINGATNTSFTIASVGQGDFGTYRVVVSNPNGAVASDPAELLPAMLPTAITLPQSLLTSTGARLNGSVNPNGLLTTVIFEWGAATNYDNATAPQMLNGGLLPVPVVADVAGLAAGTNYHFRISASNALGTSAGEDFTFAWLNTVPVISSFVRLPDGSVQIRIQAVAGQVYQVEGSTNVINFDLLGNAQDLGDGTFEFNSATAGAGRFNFFRVVGP